MRKKIFKRILLVLLLSLLIIGCFYLFKPIKYYLNNLNEFKLIIKEYGAFSSLIIFLLQVLQVIIAIIPGDAVNLLSGYVLGPWHGFIVSFSGIMCGSLLAFYLSRKFGRSLVEKLVKKDKLESVFNKINPKMTSISLLILCSIPFMPRDVLVYAMGLTPIKAKKFFVIYGISRFPLILLMSFTGNTLFSSSKLTVILLTLLFSIFILYFGFKKKKNI